MDINNIFYSNSKHKLKILLVEDDLACQLIISVICKKLGWKLVTCDNGKDAIETYKNEKFDIVIMDIILPGMNGYVLSSVLRSIESISNDYTPILACTGYTEGYLKENCSLAGIDDIILKPFLIEDLVLKIWAGSQSQYNL